MRSFVIREDQLQAVVNYLATKPYVEVAPLIEALQHVPEFSETEPPAKEKGDR